MSGIIQSMKPTQALPPHPKSEECIFKNHGLCGAVDGNTYCNLDLLSNETFSCLNDNNGGPKFKPEPDMSKSRRI